MITEINLQEINKILSECSISDIITGVKKLKGTTEGVVYHLEVSNEPKYVLKFDHMTQVLLVEQFLNMHQNSTLLPQLIYTAPDKTYFIYSYIKGKTHIDRGSKRDWLKVVVTELLNKYNVYTSNNMWGRLDYPCHSWFEFNAIGIGEARISIGDVLPVEDHSFIESLAVQLFNDAENRERYLLHGDTGIHNFVFDQFSLVGIIDPSPMVGPLIYDFMYAFCSSPDDINVETLFAAFDLLEHVPMDRFKLIQEVAIQLYCRIGICLRHHPEDLEGYLAAWQYWKTQLLMSI